MSDSLILIDGHYQVYRSFFAFGTRPLTNSEGHRVEAAYTVAQLLWRIYRELQGSGGKRDSDSRWAFAMDASGPTFRHEQYPEYKANREAMPDELRRQLPWVETIVRGFRIPVLKIDGYEADDAIATASTLGASRGWSVEILSKDKDLEQVLSSQIKLRREPASRDLYGPEELLVKRGIRPDQVIDYQALIGDSTDNIPGVKGIGPKTAIKILSALEELDASANVERLLEDPPPEIPAAALKKVRANPDALHLSRELVHLRTDAPLPSDPSSWKLENPSLDDLQPIFLQLGFQKLLKEMVAELGSPTTDLRPEDTLFAGLSGDEQSAPPPPAEAGDYSITATEELDAVVRDLREVGRVTIATDPTGEIAVEERARGIALSWESGRAHYVDLSQDDERAARIEALAPVLTDSAIALVGHDLKTQAQLWRSDGVHLRALEIDTMIWAYLINPTSGGYRLDTILAERFGWTRPTVTHDTPLEERARAYAADADFGGRLAESLRPEIEAAEVDRVARELEMPLIPILVDMERHGIRLDPAKLAEQESELAKACEELETSIHQAAGTAFNIGSPKQLQEILFDRLELEPIKKTKTGYSTSAEVLEELAVRHPEQPIPARILEYRTLTKLLNTYVQALPKLLNTETGRLHTDLRQTVAATGRLASHRPNLQNIPIRTEVGRRIRRAFVPTTDRRSFLSADYSQIELRILAHYCGDTGLREAMSEGADIHREVAARIHEKDSDDVTYEERSAAKAVTFGVIYGMGAFGLSRDLGISRAEAAEFIDTFFARFPGVREFIDSTIANAYEATEVRTLFGRRRPLPELGSRMQRDRKQGERYAVNTVIQGSAADLIKKAMIDVHSELGRRESKSAMLLQIHDELLFEVDRSDLDTESKWIRDCMESVLDLEVPLVVNVSSGDNWYDASK